MKRHKSSGGRRRSKRKKRRKKRRRTRKKRGSRRKTCKRGGGGWGPAIQRPRGGWKSIPTGNPKKLTPLPSAPAYILEPEFQRYLGHGAPGTASLGHLNLGPADPWWMEEVYEFPEDWEGHDLYGLWFIDGPVGHHEGTPVMPEYMVSQIQIWKPEDAKQPG